jgi:hypothetical protein
MTTTSIFTATTSPQRTSAYIDATADPVIDALPLVRTTRRFALDSLLPQALASDLDGVPDSHITALRDLGTLNHTAPSEHGGRGVGPGVDRRIGEWIAYGDLNTWLVWAQHAGAVPRLAALEASGHKLGPLAVRALRGEILLGAGLSDPRGFPKRYINAKRVPDGWVFDGIISWVSGWGLNDALTVAAVEPESGTVVTGIFPVGEHSVGHELDIQAVRGSRTWRVELRSAHVPDAETLSTQPWEEWNRADQAKSGDAHSGLFGLTFRLLDELNDSPDAQTRAVAEAWVSRVVQIRDDAYRLSDETRASGTPGHLAAERGQAKQAALDTLEALSRGLLVSRAGSGLLASDSAQLYARAALFLRVQSQTSTARSRQLRRLADLARLS